MSLKPVGSTISKALKHDCIRIDHLLPIITMPGMPKFDSSGCAPCSIINQKLPELLRLGTLNQTISNYCANEHWIMDRRQQRNHSTSTGSYQHSSFVSEIIDQGGNLFGSLKPPLIIPDTHPVGLASTQEISCNNSNTIAEICQLSFQVYSGRAANYPFTTAKGTKRATFRAIPAPETVSITSSTSL